MLQAFLIGNIGADAEVKVADGREFVTFRVAHNESYTDANQQRVERSQWIDCTMSCTNGRPPVLPYLRAGALVFISGNVTTRVYSSAKDHCMKAGVTIHVQRVELLGGQPDAIPRKIIDADGVLHDVTKYYHIEGKAGTYADLRGRAFEVDKKGWVSPKQLQEDEAQVF